LHDDLQNIQAILPSSEILSERQTKELIWPEVGTEHADSDWDVNHEL
jgi:hypothetical protein